MTRPKKQTVDYFPHDCDCSNKKTLFILEQKYGNDGYAFWFKLLEVLGSSEGHIIDCSNPATWEFLQARTRTSSDTCNEILEILVNVEAIDKELWKEKRIWCDNFVQRIGSVYLNRRVEIPTKPDNYDRNPTHTGITTRRKPQTKLKETKLKETKLKYRDFVYLKINELEKLQGKFGIEGTSGRIEKLNNYIGSTGKKYKSHYHTILNWESKNNALLPKDQPEAEPGKYANVDVMVINNDE